MFGLVASSGDKLLSPLVLGQFACNDFANEESMLFSLYILVLKVEHCACPMVCAPEINDFKIKKKS